MWTSMSDGCGRGLVHDRHCHQRSDQSHHTASRPPRSRARDKHHARQPLLRSADLEPPLTAKRSRARHWGCQHSSASAELTVYLPDVSGRES